MNGDATVFVVDDDASVRHALTRLLQAGGYTPEAFDSGEAFLRGFHSDRPGCLLLDLKMPGMSGLDVQAALAERGALLPIIFLTGHASVPATVRALKSGAFEFLEKPVAGEVLLEYVRRALHLDATRRQEHAMRSELRARHETLTAREREILPLVAAGRSSKEVARAFGISHRTVELHRARIMRKLGATTVVEVAEMTRAVAVDDDIAEGDTVERPAFEDK